MTGFEIVQAWSDCVTCKKPFKEGDAYRMRAFDLRRKGWSKFNRRLKADHTMRILAHVDCASAALEKS